MLVGECGPGKVLTKPLLVFAKSFDRREDDWNSTDRSIPDIVRSRYRRLSSI